MVLRISRSIRYPIAVAIGADLAVSPGSQGQKT